MNQFTIPQFIDVEDKIFGPITTRQFSILLGAAAPIFIAFKLADRALFFFLAFLIGGIAIIFAFVRINNQAFHYFILNIFEYVKMPTRRLWYKVYYNSDLQEYLYEVNKKEDEGKKEPVERKQISNSRIRDLSLLVNTGGYYKPE